MEGIADSAAVATELAALNSLEQQPLTQLLELVLRFLTAPKAMEFQQELAEFIQTSGLNVAAMKGVVRTLLVFFQDAMKEGWNLNHLKAKASERGLEDTAADVLCAVWRVQYHSISSSILSRTLAANQLVDLEWKFGVTASTDDVMSVGATYLQMKLVIDRGDGQRENVYMEMTLDQFYSFMAQMEKAKAYMDFLSAES